uniref:Uncharacterized protein n=1 Tax=Mycena chlorophos TaxID=658473 RepID=A0ABQ0M1A7_MYCCL|nr:predicted protein [Mycena chlorophos]
MHDLERRALPTIHSTKQSEKSRIHPASKLKPAPKPSTKANATSSKARVHETQKHATNNVSSSSTLRSPPKPPPTRPSFSTLTADLEAVRKDNVALISDLCSQLKASNQRYLAEHKRLLTAHEEYSDLQRQAELYVGIEARRNERMAEQLKAANQLAQMLQTQLDASQMKLQTTEEFLVVAREGRDKAERELKALKEGIKAREEEVRRAQKRLDERGYELLDALEKSRDALWEGISGTQAGKRKARDQLEDDSHKSKKAKKAVQAQEGGIHRWKRPRAPPHNWPVALSRLERPKVNEAHPPHRERPFRPAVIPTNPIAQAEPHVHAERRRPSFSTLASDLEAIQAENATVISDLRSHLKDYKERYRAERQRVLNAHEEHSELQRQGEQRLGIETQRNERLAEQLEAANQLVKTLETQLGASQKKLQATEKFLVVAREGRDKAETELKTVKEGIEAREEGVRQAQERLDERGHELLQALEKSKDALLQGISGTQPGKRKAHDDLEDDSPKLKKLKTEQSSDNNNWERGTRLRSAKTGT